MTFLLLISSTILLWSENILYMISILPNLLRLVLRLKMWLIVVNFSLYFLEESIYSCCEMECFLNVN